MRDVYSPSIIQLSICNCQLFEYKFFQARLIHPITPAGTATQAIYQILSSLKVFIHILLIVSFILKMQPIMFIPTERELGFAYLQTNRCQEPVTD